MPRHLPGRERRRERRREKREEERERRREERRKMREPGFEPESSLWKSEMITTTLYAPMKTTGKAPKAVDILCAFD